MKRMIVIFSGAGLSAESGIPTFRASDGLWENHKIEEVAYPSGWKADKKKVLDFYSQRFHSYRHAQPNAAHLAFAELESEFDVRHITQNIDDLLERAGCTNIRHLHGSAFVRKCENHKDIAATKDKKFSCDHSEPQDKPVEFGDLCPKCGGHMRPAIVWFEEAVSMTYDSIMPLVKEVKYNDGVFICVGTSAQVYPAASLISFFSQVPHKYIINLEPTPIADYTLLKGPASIETRKLVDQLLTPAN